MRELGTKCTEGALRRCDRAALRGCAGTRGSNCSCRGRGSQQADGAWRKVHSSDVGDGDALPQHLIGRSQSRRVFSPSAPVKKAKDREERWG